jgi:hypothetical protein
MASINKYRGKKGTPRKSATRGKAKVVDTFACGCCTPIVTIDDCGCMETRILC